MWYVFNKHKNLADKDNVYTAGETYIFDGVEVYCLLGTGEADHPLFVDKNHDLSYYVNGSDWVDSSDYDTSPGTYGYEWGGYGTETGIQDTAVGTGLSNTNQLISKNLQPDTSGWYVVWDKVNEFRQSHSDKWFVPSQDELNLVYENRSSLNNLSLNVNHFYWSSSEYSSGTACKRTALCQYFGSGYQDFYSKFIHFIRSRLCYTI